MAKISDYSVAELEYFLIEELGNITAVANRLHVTRSQLKNRIDTSPELKLAQGEIIQSILDKAENNVFQAIEAGDVKESKFLLSNLGKDRGYTTKTEIEGSLLTGQGAVDRINEARKRAMERGNEDTSAKTLALMNE